MIISEIRNMYMDLHKYFCKYNSSRKIYIAKTICLTVIAHAKCVEMFKRKISIAFSK